MILVAFAPPSRAAGADSGKASPPSSSIEDLQSGIDRPEDFQKIIEGSRARHGALDEPGFVARPKDRAAGASPRLDRPQSGLWLKGMPVPPTAAAERSGMPPSRYAFPAGLPVRKLAAVLGLGFMLIAASMLETPIERETEPLRESPSRFVPPSGARAPEPDLAPARAAGAVPDQPFIDTRMPAPTWRAISRREQQLIERWDASREKALGLASLPEWLDIKGPVEGVDLPLLKAKLHRQA